LYYWFLPVVAAVAEVLHQTVNPAATGIFDSASNSLFLHYYHMRKYFLIFGLLCLIFVTLESCGGSRGLGKGKQKKSCNCGF